MDWNIDFIRYEDFKEHVRNTIRNYGEKIVPYDLKKFNSNIIDPVKMVFDKSVYKESWETLISNEIFRQRDKSNTNEIGYFHQRIFEYIAGCHVPDNGKEGGWDVVYNSSEGYILGRGNCVHKIYVEMKNKHNTMNSSASAKTYIKMQHQLLEDDDCACFLVEAIAKRSQNIIWKTTVDRQKVSHIRIRRVSIDKFYEIVTGEEDAFFKICMVLPDVVNEVLSEAEIDASLEDTVYREIREAAAKIDGITDEASIVLSMYALGFKTYSGFKDYFSAE